MKYNKNQKELRGRKKSKAHKKLTEKKVRRTTYYVTHLFESDDVSSACDICDLGIEYHLNGGL